MRFEKAVSNGQSWEGGSVKKDMNRNSDHRPVDADALIEYYESRPLDDVRRELEQLGVDASGTVEAVRRLIEDSLISVAPVKLSSSDGQAGRRFRFRPSVHHVPEDDGAF